MYTQFLEQTDINTQSGVTRMHLSARKCDDKAMLSIRSRPRAVPLFYSILILTLLLHSVTAVQYSQPIPCGPIQQNEIMRYSQENSCTIREKVVDLRPYVANLSDVIHVVPDVAVVMRCGGNCVRPSHRCIPTVKKMKSVPIMMIITRFPHGNHDSVCGHVDVEEHESCACNCPLRSEDCHHAIVGDTTSPHVDDKYFDSGSCRCLCRNREVRHACISSGMDWDDSLCRCTCPKSRWHHCSTGYVFDMHNTCRCVPTSMTASLGLIAALIVLIVCILVTAVGFFTMYRRQTGLFRQSRRERIVRESQLLKHEETGRGTGDRKTSTTSKQQNLARNYDLVLNKETDFAEKK